MAGGIDLGGGGDRPMSEINVTPLVDVMLVLLVIFILTAPLLAQALRVDLPKVSAQPSGEPRTVTVTVRPDGALLLEDEVLSQEVLAARLAQALAAEPELVTRLAADGSAAYQSVADAIALLRRAGVKRLAFATQGG